MKALPVFLINNIPVEFYIANPDTNKLILNYLVCKDEKTFDLTKCMVYINDKPVNFIKSGWATPSVFHVNGIPDKASCQAIEPLSKITFTLMIDCKKGEEEKYAGIRFHLHLSLEADPVNHQVLERGYGLGGDNRLKA